jgi:hypothetical protein
VTEKQVQKMIEQKKDEPEDKAESGSDNYFKQVEI